ncbi:hypothetical protein THRCLA_02868 [Thraustotheca clavata]|uniref:Uncharacterized protein n=1 Tax=Thraustotheca clavata TaxID=74557 RepID=A0A1W0A416_9STRA|nr:hypothetical protein THRCLA_02868 [Thraustotheca clavata]
MGKVVHGWEWATNALWTEEIKCCVRLIDTVLIEGGRPTRWLFASKHGTITKKKDDHLDLYAIADRFVRLSQHPKNTMQYTAYVLFRNGNRKLMDETQLREMIEMLLAPTRAPAVTGIYAYVQPNEMGTMYAVEYKAKGGILVTKQSNSAQMLDPGDAVPLKIRKEIERIVGNVVQFLQSSAQVYIEKMLAEFVVDDDNVLWLMHIPHTVAMSTLNQSQSLPALPQSNVNESTKCRGEFCRMKCSDLPGLYPPPHSSRVPLEDTGQRFKIGFNNVLLARAEMQFLLNPNIDSAQWKQADSAQRAELGRSNPSHFYKQVTVCPNCNQIYAHLQNLRQNSFRNENSQREDNEERTEATVIKKSKKKAKPKFDNQPTNHSNLKPSDTLLQFMGVPQVEATQSTSYSDDQIHEAAFMAELAKQSQLLAPLSTRQPEVDSPNPEIPPPKKSTHKKKSKDNQTILTQFEDEWNQVEASNKAYLSENVKLKETLGNLEAKYTAEKNQWEQERITLNETNVVLEKQSKQLGKRMSSMQKEFSDSLAEKETYFRRQLLQTEQLCNDKLSQQPAPSKQDSTHINATNQLSLIETIEQLTAQLDKEQRDREIERQRLQASHQQEMTRLFERQKLDTESLRVVNRQYIDSMEELKTQLFTSQQQTQVAQTQAKQFKAQIQEAYLVKTSLEERIATLETQSTAQNIGTSKVSGTEMAMEKLNHKIDYLKAQLASEIRCKEELGSTVATLTVNIETMKKERKKLTQDTEESHRKMIEKLEERQRQEIDMISSQNSSLQSKVVQLQANITDLVSDLSAARNKEDNAKLSTEKMAEENARLYKRIAELELSNEELTETINGTKSSLDDANRANLEATLRRLTHERQYLKSQMEGEARCKDELQLRLQEITAQLQDSQNNAKTELSAFKQSSKDKEITLQAQIAKLEECNVLTVGELSSVKHQWNEAKLALYKARERNDADQTEIEATRTEVAQMKMSLIAAKEELLKERERSKGSSDRQTKSIAAIKASLIQMEEAKNSEHLAFQEELSQNQLKLSKANTTILELEALQIENLKKSKRALALQVILRGIEYRQKRAMALRWLKWSDHTKLLRVVVTQGVKLSETLQAREAVWHERLETMCNDVTEKLILEKEVAMSNVRESLLSDTSEQLKNLANEHTQALRARDEEHKKHCEEVLDKCKAQYEHEMEAMEENHIKAIENLQEAAKIHQIQIESEMNTLRQNLVDQEREMRDNANAVLTQTLREMEMAHQEEIKQLHDSFEKQKRDLQATHANQLDMNTEEFLIQKQEYELQVLAILSMEKCEQEEILRLKYSEHLKTILAQQMSTHESAISDMQQQHVKELDEVIAHWTQLLDKERHTHAATIKDHQNSFDSKLVTELENCRRELLEQKGNAIMSTTAKWQRALADTNARLETEKKVWYEKGVADRESEWQKAAALIKQAQKDEVEKLERDSKLALKCCEEKFELLLAMKTEDMQKSFNMELQSCLSDAKNDKQEAINKAIAKVERETKDLLTNEWLSKMAAEKADHEKQLVDACEEVEKKTSQEYAQRNATEREKWEARKADELYKLQASFREELKKTLENEKGALKAHYEAKLRGLDDEWTQKHNEITEQITNEANERLKSNIRSCEEAAAKLHEEQMVLVQEESEKLIEKVEEAMQQLKKQKENTELELQRVTQALEEAEDAAFDMQEEISTIKKYHAFHHLVLLKSGLQKLQHLVDEIDSKEMEKRSLADEWQQKLEDSSNTFTQQLGQSQKNCAQLEQIYSKVYETLVNYKRDELIQHRSASNVVTGELSVLHAQITQVLDTKAESERDIDKTQAELGALEEEISQIQLMKDGHVNQAQVARKRRLHQESEMMLETIETKKTKIRGIDAKLQELHGSQRAKEEEMKGLERQLVQILVEQQKQLLSLITAARASPMQA